MVGSVSRQMGMPPMKQLCEPIMARPGPTIMPLATPPMAPASSPLVTAYMLPMFSSGMQLIMQVK